MLAKDMEMLAWNLKGWSTRHSGLGRIEALKFCRRYMIFLRKKQRTQATSSYLGLVISFWSLFCTPYKDRARGALRKNFGVRTDVQSVPLTQTIHTTTIACSLSALLWLLIVHFEELRFERISMVQNARNEVCFLADLSSFDLTDHGVGRFFRDRIWNL